MSTYFVSVINTYCAAGSYPTKRYARMLLGDYLSGSNVSVAQRGGETNSFLEGKFESSSGSLTKEFL